MVDLTALKAANTARWGQAKVTRRADFMAVAKSLVAAKPRYLAVQAQTGVPWYVIAVIHEREASQRWDTHLGQGDPLHEITRHVPAARPAFATWEEGAVDALVNCPPHLARNKDWSPGGTLTGVQGYNGFGYGENPSPYIWSGTDQYVKGKFVRDHVYDPNAIDRQLGCAGLLMAMIALDRTISFDGQPNVIVLPTKPNPPVPDTPDVPRPDPVPQPKPAAPSFWVTLFAALLSLFTKRK